jgi:hypothetical protein
MMYLVLLVLRDILFAWNQCAILVSSELAQYKQYVRPHLEFSSPAWSPWLQGDKEALEKVQEKAIKMVAGLKGSIYEEKCEELGNSGGKKRRTGHGTGS